VALHAVSLLLTLGGAALAFRYVETPFLRLKSRIGAVEASSTR
jgi:peptidoglycan/LPS O-acetylase OafA/YrhL